MEWVAQRWVTPVRWIARVWSLCSLALVTAFIIGEGLTVSGVAQWIGFALFPVGVLAGMVAAWKNEQVGGWVTVASLAAFYFVYGATTGTLPPGWGWLVIAAPGFLFLLASYLSGSSRAVSV